jgi:hypothetical protein
LPNAQKWDMMPLFAVSPETISSRQEEFVRIPLKVCWVVETRKLVEILQRNQGAALSLRGHGLLHQTLGFGRIVNVELNSVDGVHLEVLFDDSGVKRPLRCSPLCEAGVVLLALLPGCPIDAQIKNCRVPADGYRFPRPHVQAIRGRVEEPIPRSTGKTKQRKKKPTAIARTTPRCAPKQEHAQRLGADLERRRRMTALIQKFEAPTDLSWDSEQMLLLILGKLESGESLDASDIECLHRFGCYFALATWFERAYEMNREPQSLVQACGWWQRSGQPDRALQLSDRLIRHVLRGHIVDELRVPLFVARGNAFADVGNLGEAEKCAKIALVLHDSPDAHILAGRVRIQRGDVEAGHEAFETARQFGADETSIRCAVEASFRKLGSSDRQRCAAWLVHVHPHLYTWAKLRAREAGPEWDHPEAAW